MLNLRVVDVYAEHGLDFLRRLKETLPAPSHTAVITQAGLLHALIEPFLKGQTPKGMFEASGAQ